MSVISESWIQNIAHRIRLPALDPGTVKILIPALEMHAKQLAIQAEKFRRRSKSRVLTYAEINEALSLNKKERLYGVSSVTSDANLDVVGTIAPVPAQDSVGIAEFMEGRVDLASVVKRPLPPTPLLPDIHLHYLAVMGVQPSIPENPVIEVQEEEELFVSANLSKEAKDLFVKIVRTLSNSTDEGELVKIREFLSSRAPWVPLLLPYISQYLHGFGKIYANSVIRQRILVKALECLLFNPHIDIKPHFRHIVPCILSLVVGSRQASAGTMTSSDLTDYFAMKSDAARLMYFICYRYGDDIDDLTARVCKTYLEALSSNKEVKLESMVLGDMSANTTTASGGGGGGSSSSKAGGGGSSTSSNIPEIMDILSSITGKTLDTVFGGLQGLSMMGPGPLALLMKPTAGTTHGRECLWADVYARLNTVLKYAGQSVSAYVNSVNPKKNARQKIYTAFLNRFNSAAMCMAAIVHGLATYIIDCFANLDISTTKKMIENLLQLLEHVDLGEQLAAVNNKVVNAFAIGHKKEAINKGLDFFELVI